jgi:hypothetical protein
MCRVTPVRCGLSCLVAVAALLTWRVVQAQTPAVPAPVQVAPAPPAPKADEPKDVKKAKEEADDVAVSPGFAQRFNIVIDPKTPLAELLPTAPRHSRPTNRFLDDLSHAPEIDFQLPLATNLTSDMSSYQIAYQVAKIRHLNQQKTDGFVQALLGKRDDLKALPMAMGAACRTTGPRAAYLAFFSTATRFSLAQANGENPGVTVDAGKFWAVVTKNLQAAEAEMAKAEHDGDRDDFEAARAAAWMQILAPESTAMRLGLVKQLSKTPHVEATKALARLALFSAEDEVRVATIAALKLRRERDVVPTLMQGFRYPLPEVAKRAADALIRLDCTDAVPQLVDLLDEADPRMPFAKNDHGKKRAMVNEIVRINHHRNCILCHAPFDDATNNLPAMFQKPFVLKGDITRPESEASEQMVSGPGGSEKVRFNSKVNVKSSIVAAPSLASLIPLPNEPLPSISDGGYGSNTFADISVRFDMTYLRQDFSLMLPVIDAAPWPTMQRFDFLVRTRELSPEEVQEYRQNAPTTAASYTTPYQRAILLALRELTQRDTGPTSQAWRELLKLPGKK